MAEPSGSNYPTSVDDSTSLLAAVTNQKSYVVSGAHSSSIATITTTATISGVTAPGYLVCGRTGEIIHFAGISGTQFTTCTRGADGTTNAAMVDGDVLYHSNVAKYHNQLRAAVLAVEGDSIYVRAGWVPAVDTWTYASATSFTITGVDRTTTYTKGTKLKCTDNSTTKYFYVTSSSFSTNTTVNITGGSDYSLAGGAITNPYYSYAESPQGFPDWFNYSPSITGYSANPTGGMYRFCIKGRTVFVSMSEPTDGTSNATSKAYGLPVAAATKSGFNWGGVQSWARDNGADVNTACWTIVSGSSSLSAYKTLGFGTWTGSAACRVWGNSAAATGIAAMIIYEF